MLGDWGTPNPFVGLVAGWHGFGVRGHRGEIRFIICAGYLIFIAYPENQTLDRVCDLLGLQWIPNGAAMQEKNLGVTSFLVRIGTSL